MNFKELQLDHQILEGLESMGFKEATPIQEQAIPAIMQGQDLLACAQTGTGKTAAFILPIIHKVLSEPVQGINALVIVPTRELAQQIDQQIEGLAYFAPVTSMAVFGGGDGQSWEAQKKSLREGVDIVVATPGRLIAMMNMDILNFTSLKYLVLDEADRMLDMGFQEDIFRIIKALPEKRQNLLFSATMPPRITALARKILHKPVQINLSLSKPAEGITQLAYIVYNQQKDPLLLELLSNSDYDSILIFCSTKQKVKNIGEMLIRKKMNIEPFHSDLEQKDRDRILRDFKNKTLRIIVATDVLSRGIDVDNISLVINYDAPGDPEDYVHRVGRTARAARLGMAVTFVGEEDQMKFSMVEKLIGYEVEKPKLPLSLGEGPDYNGERAGQQRNPRRQWSGRKTTSGNNTNKAGGEKRFAPKKPYNKSGDHSSFKNHPRQDTHKKD